MRLHVPGPHPLEDVLLLLIQILIGLAALCFLAGVIARFVRKHEGTVWYRGTMGLLAFAIALLLLEILGALGGVR